MRRCLLLASVLISTLLSSASLAQTVDFDVLVDADRSATTGCTITPSGGGSIDGIEARLRATVDPASLSVIALETASCSGGSFGPATPVGGVAVPFPIAIDVGTDGSDAVELAADRAALGADGTSLIELVFVADNGDGSDVLATTDGTADSGPILLGLPLQVPALSLLGLGLLILALLVLAALAHRRMGRAGAVLTVMLVATAVWAMNFAADGDLADWTGAGASANDPAGDASDGADATDLRAAFIGFEGDRLYFRLDVTDLENRPPTAVDDAYATDEDTALNVAAPGVLDNDTDPEGDPLTAVLVAAPANALSFSLSPDGSFDYTPAADFNGSDSFMYLASDDQAVSAAATVTITINPVDDPPLAIAGLASTDEDTPVTITLNGTDPDGDTLSFAIATGPTNGSLGAITPIDADTAEVTYTPDPDYNGGDSFSFTVDDGTTTSAAAAISITVNPVNDPPVADAQLVNAVEDTPIVITLTGSDIDGDALSFAVASGPSNGSLGAITPLGPTSAEVTYTPDIGYVGTDSFTFTVNDGTVPSPAATVDIDVAPGNEIPVADAQSTATFEDTPLVVTLTGSDADGDPLTFAIATAPNNGSLGAITPLGPTSALVTYTPDPDFNGADSFEFTANDGTDTSPAATVTINVNAINDAPSFTAGPDVDVAEDSGAYNQPWATAISAGPADESGQNLNFDITANDNPGLFAAGPAIDASTGNLSFTPADDAFGSANLTVVLSDDGGTANGGIDSSAGVNLVITVTPINDAPSFVAGADPTVLEDAGPQMLVGWATAISPGPANEAGQSLNFNVTGNTNPGLFSAGPSVGPTGTLSFTSAANAFGSATITLTLSDNGGTADGGLDTSPPQNFTIVVDPVNDPPSVVNQSLTTHSAIRITLGAGDSQLLKDGASDIDDPTSALSVSALPATSTNGALLTLIDGATGTYRYDPPGGFVGADSFSFEVCDSATTAAPVQCASGTVNVTVTGPPLWVVNPAAPPGGDGSLNRPFQTLSSLPGGRATNGRVFLASGNNAGGHSFVAGERLYGQGAAGNSFDGFLGVQVPANGTLDARPAIGGTRPVVQGQVTLANGVTAQSFNIAPAGGTQGLIGNGAFTGISVSQMNVATSGATAVNLSGLTGSFTLDRVDANGGTSGIILNNANSASGSFTIVGSGTAGSGGTIQNMTGDGVRLASTQGVTLNFMNLTNTASTNGPGPCGTNLVGNTGCNAAIDMLAVANVNLVGIGISGGQQYGINGNGVAGFNLTGSTISNSGNALEEDGIRFINLTGTSLIRNTTVQNSHTNNLRIYNTVATPLTLTIDETVAGSSRFLNALFNDGILFEGLNSANMTLSVSGTDFDSSDGDHIQTTVDDNATMSVIVQNNVMSANADPTVLGSGITLSSSADFNGLKAFNISNNTINGANAKAINVNMGTSTAGGGTGTYEGVINNNTIGTNGVAQSGGFGIDVLGNGGGTITAQVTGNSIQQFLGDHGIRVLHRDGNGRINATVASNTVRLPEAGGFNGIVVQGGATSGPPIDSGTICLDFSGNTMAGSGAGGGGATDFRLRQRFNTTFQLRGYVGAAGDTAAVVAYVQGINPGAESGSATAETTAPSGSGFINTPGGAACPLP